MIDFRVKKVESKLPKVLSQAILAAVDDLGKVERSKKYHVNMSEWHRPITDDYEAFCNCEMCTADREAAKAAAAGAICEVCFAGALIAKTCGVSPKTDFAPYDDTGKVGHAMQALDSVRSGYLSDAIDEWPWGRKRTKERALKVLSVRPKVPNYETDRAGFKRAMRSIARALEKLGL